MPVTDDSVCTCLAIRQAARQITQLYDTEMAEAGLRITQYALLVRLSKRGPLTVQELAEALVMDRSTLGHNLRPLERDGLVAIAVDGEDRRVRRLHLTAAGKEKVKEAQAAWKRAQQRFNSRYGEDDVAQLRQLLRRAVDAASP
jgi:DNA-binding MarR family transcriptional regulator